MIDILLISLMFFSVNKGQHGTESSQWDMKMFAISCCSMSRLSKSSKLFCLRWVSLSFLFLFCFVFGI